MQCSDLSSNNSGIFFIFSVPIRQLINQLSVLVDILNVEEDIYQSDSRPMYFPTG